MITNPLWVVNTRIKIQGLKCGTEKQKTAPTPLYRGIIGKNWFCPRQLNRPISKLKLRLKIFYLIQGKSFGYVTHLLKTENFTIRQYLNRQWEILLHSNVVLIEVESQWKKIIIFFAVWDAFMEEKMIKKSFWFHIAFSFIIFILVHTRWFKMMLISVNVWFQMVYVR